MKLIARLWPVLVVVSLFFLFAGASPAQDQEKFGAFGLGFNDQASPKIQGWAALAIPVADRVLSYTAYDIAPVKEGGQVSFAGVRLNYMIRTGVAYRIYEIAPGWTLWGLGNAGMSADGNVVVGAFEYGGFLDKSFGKGWGFMAVLAAQKDAISGTTFSPRFGFRKKL